MKSFSISISYGCQGLKPRSTTNQLRDPKKFTKYLFASVSSYVKWDNNSEDHSVNRYNTHRTVPDTEEVLYTEDDDRM